MPSKKRGSNIKKDRLMLILKSRKITITKLAEDLKYNRSALSSAINGEYMDNQTLDDIARYLDVSPDFITGKTALLKLKSEKRDEFYENYGSDLLDPSGYVVYSYSDYLVAKYIEEHNKTPLTVQIPEYGYLYQAFSELGKNGIYDGKTKSRKFDDSFIKEHFNYLIVETYGFMKAQAVSVLIEDQKYLDYTEREKWYEESAMQEANYFDSFFDVIEEGQQPEKVTDE